MTAACDGSDSGRISLSVEDRIRVGSAPQGVAAGEDAIWVTVAGEPGLVRVEPESGRASAAAKFGRVPAGVALAGGGVWVGFAEGREIVRLAPDDPSGRGSSIKVGRTPQAVSPDEEGGGVWVAALNEPAVVHVDGSGRVTQKIDLGAGFPGAVAAGFGRVWVPDVVANQLLAIDAGAGGKPRRVPVGNSPTAVATGEGGVWVGNFESGTVSHFDPRRNRVTGGIRVGGPVGGIAVGAGYVWVTEHKRGRLVAIDPGTDEVAGSVEVGGIPQGVAVAPDGSVWVAVQDGGVLVRVAVR